MLGNSSTHRPLTSLSHFLSSQVRLDLPIRLAVALGMFNRHESLLYSQPRAKLHEIVAAKLFAIIREKDDQ